MGNKTRYSTCTLTKVWGRRKNQMGIASSVKKKSAASAAGKKRARIGDAWMKITNAANRESITAPATPMTPRINQLKLIAAADRPPHQIQISESINGSLTKRK